MEPGKPPTYVNIPDSARICAEENSDMDSIPSDAGFENLNIHTDRKVPIPDRLRELTVLPFSGSLDRGNFNVSATSVQDNTSSDWERDVIGHTTQHRSFHFLAHRLKERLIYLFRNRSNVTLINRQASASEEPWSKQGISNNRFRRRSLRVVDPIDHEIIESQMEGLPVHTIVSHTKM